MQEKILISALKEGDENAFRDLVDSFQLKVVNTCYGFLHDRDEAEDIAQDVFVEIYHSIHKFREDSSLSTWIYRIAVNKSLNRKKRLNKRSLFSSFSNGDDDSFAYADLKSEAPLADEIIIKDEEKQKLHKAIDRLPENQKTALILSKFEDMSYKEISEIMDLSISSIESLLFRAKQNLVKRLKHK